jgi:hypothetical protein
LQLCDHAHLLAFISTAICAENSVLEEIMRQDPNGISVGLPWLTGTGGRVNDFSKLPIQFEKHIHRSPAEAGAGGNELQS